MAENDRWCHDSGEVAAMNHWFEIMEVLGGFPDQRLESRLGIVQARNVPGGAHPAPIDRIERLCPTPD
jgi:hypothetical protein